MTAIGTSHEMQHGADALRATAPATAVLAYDDHGSGAPPVVLLHGLGDNRGVMAQVDAQLARRHRTVNVDLRGHGESPAPHGDYSVGALAADVAAVCGRAGIERAVLVGHSLGGAVALQIAAQDPGLAVAVVLLEGAVLFRAEVLEQSAGLMEAITGPGWRDAMHAFVDAGFIDTDDPALRERHHAEVERLSQHVVTGIMTAAARWDAEAVIRACDVPVLYVEAGSGLADLERFAELCPQLEIGRTVGVGHNQMLATPDQVVAMIDRFVAVHVPGA